MLIVAPLGGDARDLRVPTTYLEDVNGGLPRRRCWRSGVPTTYLEDVDGGLPGR
jgi:hypothetical protein